MSRMIADMYRPPLSDPAQNDSTDESELEEQSLCSDIGELDQSLDKMDQLHLVSITICLVRAVEAAGGGGLQLFVDSNVSVDSALIRQLVNEVLTETVAQMLYRTNTMDTAPEPGLEMPKSEPTGDNEVQKKPLLNSAHYVSFGFISQFFPMQQKEPASLVPTPAPTPLPSGPQLSRESTPAATPPPSKPSSPVPQDPTQPITASGLPDSNSRFEQYL